MNYGRIYWGLLVVFGALILLRNGAALLDPASGTGPLPSAVAVVAGVGVLLVGLSGLSGPIEGPDRPTLGFVAVVLLVAWQAVSVLVWLAGRV